MAKTLVVLAVLAGGYLWFFGWPGSEPAAAGGPAVILDPASVRADSGPAGADRPGSPGRSPRSQRTPRAGTVASREPGSPAEGKPADLGARKGRGQPAVAPRGTRAGIEMDEVEGRASKELGLSDESASPFVADYDQDQTTPTLKATHPAAPTLAERAARVEALLARAANLEAAGDLEGASAVLRQGMTGSTSPVEVARLGFYLAGLSDSPAESRRLLTNALRRGVVHDTEYQLASDMLRELNHSTGSSLLGLLRMEEYEVQPNDSLWELCNRTFPQDYGVSPEVGLIQLLNGMSGTGLRVGQKLAVPLESVTVVIDRRNHGLVAYLGGVALVSYRVGLGKEGRTPSGTFVIEVKLKEPTWYRDGKAIPFGDPDNILGTRWLGFENNPGAMGYGIHGTAHPDSVGGNESMGCVRMRNEEVEELFELLARGTTVEIP